MTAHETDPDDDDLLAEVLAVARQSPEALPFSELPGLLAAGIAVGDDSAGAGAQRAEDPGVLGRPGQPLGGAVDPALQPMHAVLVGARLHVPPVDPQAG
jgi:hypothetical protein